MKLYNIFHTHNQHTPRLYLIQLNNDTSPLRRSISDDISPSFQYYKYIYKEFYSDYTIFNDIITSMPLSKQNSASSSNDNRERDNYRIMMVVDDNSTTHCKICNKKFNILNRKHHCRLCNSIICGNCSTHKAILNRGIDDVDSDSKKPVRICDLCYSNLDIQQTY